MPKNEAVKAWAKKMVPRTEAGAAHKEAASPLPGFDKKKKPKKPKKESKWASMKDPETNFYRLGQKALRSKPKTYAERSAILDKLDAAYFKSAEWTDSQLRRLNSGKGGESNLALQKIENTRLRKYRAAQKRRSDLIKKVEAHFDKMD